jgi:hypothetical protein
MERLNGRSDSDLHEVFIGFIAEGFSKGEGLGYGVICRVGNFDIEIELEYFWMTVFSN